MQIRGQLAIWDVHQYCLVPRGTLSGSMVCEAPKAAKTDRVANATESECILMRELMHQK